MKDKKGQGSFYVPPWVLAVLGLIIIGLFTWKYFPGLVDWINRAKGGGLA